MSKEKSSAFAVLQKVGKSFFLPIATLPFAGILLGIGASFTNKTNIENLGLEKVLGEGTALNLLLKIFSGLGDVVFANLPLLFAMALGIGLAKSEKAIAGFSAAIAFLTMNKVINILLISSGKLMPDGSLGKGVPEGMITSVLGIQSLQMGVFGAIILGLIVVYLHNKYYKIELPSVISFFAGTRFVPIVSMAASIFVGIFFYLTWPYIQFGISRLGALVVESGYVGTFFYGLIERALVPFGLHHVFYIPIWTTQLGGEMEIAGKMVYGAQNIYFAQLADPTTKHFSIDAVRFLVGKYPFMMGGLPGAALAMYHCIPKEKRADYRGLYFGAGFTSFLTGITEPLEFTFLFLSPMLFVIHAFCAGISFALCHILNICVGATFSDGFIDFTIFGLLQGVAKTRWPYLVVLMGIYFAVYYFMFKYLIMKWDVKVPGRDDSGEKKLFSKADYLSKKGTDKDDKKAANDYKSAVILEGLGGMDNIVDIDSCATRLRVAVKDSDKVIDSVLKETGASGVVKKGTGIQVIYGPIVSVIKSNLEEYYEDVKAGKIVHDPNILGGSEEKVEEKVEEDKSAKVDEKPNELKESVPPMTGNLIPIEKVKDDAFSQKLMGDGFAVEPTEEKVVSPVDGTVSLVFDTKHAIGITTKDGIEILLHMGINTVSYKGKGFEVYCESGQEIKAGDEIAKMDIKFFESENIDTATCVLYTNMSPSKEVKVQEGPVKAGEKGKIEIIDK